MFIRINKPSHPINLLFLTEPRRATKMTTEISSTEYSSQKPRWDKLFIQQRLVPKTQATLLSFFVLPVLKVDAKNTIHVFGVFVPPANFRSVKNDKAYN
jgi:hypothetical protein